MASEFVGALVERCAAAIAAHADELTRLDAAIGDGDHGANMARGFNAILAQKHELAALPLGAALQKAGMTLVTSVGGAAGPLYGSLLMGTGRALDGGDDAVEAFAAGVELVRKRGKSDVGAKTMLDALVPAVAAARERKGEGPAAIIAAVRAAVDGGWEATRDMVATRGRASFLGPRSRGHYDPGATSSRLLVHAVCDVLEGAG